MFRGTFSTTLRVLQQLRHDPRSIGLMWFVPVILLILLRYVYEGQDQIFDAVGPSLLAVFPLITMFLVTSITTQRERSGGTLERLMSLPLGKAGYLVGYALAFGIMATVQAGLVTWVSFNWLGLSILGSGWLLFIVTLLVAVLGVALGLVGSALAKTEFQAVQFLPVFIMPQLLLCGLLVAREQMANWLKAISDYLPLSYAIEALQQLQHNVNSTETFWKDIGILLAFVVGGLLVGSLTLRRRT